MTDKVFPTGFTAEAALDGSEKVLIDNGTSNKTATTQQIANLAGGSITHTPLNNGVSLSLGENSSAKLFTISGFDNTKGGSLTINFAATITNMNSGATFKFKFKDINGDPINIDSSGVGVTNSVNSPYTHVASATSVSEIGLIISEQSPANIGYTANVGWDDAGISEIDVYISVGGFGLFYCTDMRLITVHANQFVQES